MKREVKPINNGKNEIDNIDIERHRKHGKTKIPIEFFLLFIYLVILWYGKYVWVFL